MRHLRKYVDEAYVDDRKFIAKVRSASLRELRYMRTEHAWSLQWKRAAIANAITRRKRVTPR